MIPSSIRTLAWVPLVAALATGCVRSYRKDAPLAFEEVPYTSLTGERWPLKTVRLEQVAAHYGMPKAPEFAYVELNPEGAQTLVFIHGLGSYLKFWRHQLDAFAAEGYRVIAVDLPGYGKSDKPASFPYSMEAMGDAVRELLGTLGVRAPILVGHSMGGQTAASYAIRYPDEVRALVLTSPAGFEEFSPKEKAWFIRAFTRELVTDASETAIWGSIRQNNFQNWRPELEWLVEERVRLAKNDAFDAYAYANLRTVAGLVETDFVRDNLRHIQAPTLIIFGEDDRLIPNPFLHGGRTKEIMAFGHRHIPRATLVGLDGCGHTVQLDCPEPFNAHVLGFLKALPALP